MNTLRLIAVLGLVLLTYNLQAQETEEAPAIVLYEVLASHTGKTDRATIAFNQLPGLQKHFYCTRNNVLYIEIEKDHVAQLEAYMNHHAVNCLPKLHCTLQRIQEQCITEFKD